MHIKINGFLIKCHILYGKIINEYSWGVFVIYNFVNIAYWKSPEDFQNAIKTSEFRALSKDIFAFSRHPGIYEVIEE